MKHRLGVIGYGNMGSWHCENVLAAIEGKETQIVTHAQIRNNMKVLMAAFESARTNQIVML